MLVTKNTKFIEIQEYFQQYFSNLKLAFYSISNSEAANDFSKGKIQLAGDLSGTAASPAIATGAVTTMKISNGAVTDAKIATISGSKVSGNITGSAANVTGTIALSNGGTAATTAACTSCCIHGLGLCSRGRQPSPLCCLHARKACGHPVFYCTTT